MYRFSTIFAVFALTTVAPLLVLADHREGSMMKKCAQVCSACQIECDSCFQHCLELVANGKSEHKASAQLCADCGEHMLACCAKCCEECAAACEKFPDDEHMAACAKSCRDCFKICSDMAKHDHK
jgi:hypothetical protein